MPAVWRLCRLCLLTLTPCRRRRSGCQLEEVLAIPHSPRHRVSVALHPSLTPRAARRAAASAARAAVVPDPAACALAEEEARVGELAARLRELDERQQHKLLAALTSTNTLANCTNYCRLATAAATAAAAARAALRAWERAVAARVQQLPAPHLTQGLALSSRLGRPPLPVAVRPPRKITFGRDARTDAACLSRAASAAPSPRVALASPTSRGLQRLPAPCAPVPAPTVLAAPGVDADAAGMHSGDSRDSRDSRDSAGVRRGQQRGLGGCLRVHAGRNVRKPRGCMMRSAHALSLPAGVDWRCVVLQHAVDGRAAAQAETASMSRCAQDCVA